MKWGRSERCYNTLMWEYLMPPLMYAHYLLPKKAWEHWSVELTYGQGIREVEHGSYTPIILSATGGMAQEATVFYKSLALLSVKKWNNNHGNWLHCCLSFLLLRSVIACVCGPHSSIGHVYRVPPSVDVVCVESHINVNDQ